MDVGEEGADAVAAVGGGRVARGTRVGEPVGVVVVAFCWGVFDELEGLEVGSGGVVSLEGEGAVFDAPDYCVSGDGGGLGGAG